MWNWEFYGFTALNCSIDWSSGSVKPYLVQFSRYKNVKFELLWLHSIKLFFLWIGEHWCFPNFFTLSGLAGIKKGKKELLWLHSFKLFYLLIEAHWCYPKLLNVFGWAGTKKEKFELLWFHSIKRFYLLIEATGFSKFSYLRLSRNENVKFELLQLHSIKLFYLWIEAH